MATKPSRSRPPKVVWTVTEKARVVSQAADVQQKRPELAGLPLLREAMLTLPPERRRKLIAVTQTPWFEPSLAEEVKRRADAAKSTGPIPTAIVGHEDDPYIPLFEQSVQTNREHVKLMAEWREAREQFEADARQAGENIVAAIMLLRRELSEFRATFVEAVGNPENGSRKPGNGHRNSPDEGSKGDNSD